MHSESIFPRDRVTIVAVLNLTPDSFSDGGRFLRQGSSIDLDRLLGCAQQLVREGENLEDAFVRVVGA